MRIANLLTAIRFFAVTKFSLCFFTSLLFPQFGLDFAFKQGKSLKFFGKLGGCQRGFWRWLFSAERGRWFYFLGLGWQGRAERVKEGGYG